MIAQTNPSTGVERPVAFHSFKFSGPELNYPIHNKELMPTVVALRQYRWMFSGPVKIYTDHHALNYFSKSTDLSSGHLARWAEILSRFKIEWHYKPGKENVVADALSRQSDMAEDDHVPSTPIIPIIHGRNVYEEHARGALNTNEISALNTAYDLILDGMFKEGYLAGQGMDDLINHKFALIKPNAIASDSKSTQPISNSAKWDEDGYLRDSQNRIIVPDYKNLRERIICLRHDAPLGGHGGQARTYEAVSRDYYWPGMKADIAEYVRTCHMCVRTKVDRRLPQGLLRTLPVPHLPFEIISTDEMSGLPEVNGKDCIIVIRDRATKYSIFIAVNKTLKAEEMAELFFDEVATKYGLPRQIISDRGSKYTSDFWAEITHLFGVQRGLLTAYHPQTDGQTERVNLDIQAYLRAFVNEKQDN